MSSKNCRVLLDEESEPRFITSEASCRLGCQLLQEEMVTTSVLGSHKTKKTMRRARVLLFSAKTVKAIEIEALKVEAICREPIPIPDLEVTRKMKEI